MPDSAATTVVLVHGAFADASGFGGVIRPGPGSHQRRRPRPRQALAAVARLTELIAEAAGDPGLIERTWVLLTEAPDGGWGLNGHANTNEDLVRTARARLAELAAKSAPNG
jgi:phenylpyruvate tautomerase PptA (4-oxalocrotonate tautomerase family)